jgi:hypothetical protein
MLRVRSFLPPGWSPAYKFTVFEDAFLVLFVEIDENGVPAREDDGFHLARPHTERGAHARNSGAACLCGPPGLPTFELVWPLKMDVAFTRQVAHTFAQQLPVRSRPGKRKECEQPVGELASEVGHKLQRLSFEPS